MIGGDVPLYMRKLIGGYWPTRRYSMYTVSGKKGATYFFAITLLNPNRSSSMMFKMSTASLHRSWQTTTPLTNRCCDVTMMSLLGTALSSKQEKIFTYLHAWSITMEHAKITKSDAKLSEIYEQNEWHLFFWAM